VFISRQHAAADPGRLVAASIPGPAYDVAGKLQLLSTHKSDGRAGFGAKSTAKVGQAVWHVHASYTHLQVFPCSTLHCPYCLICRHCLSHEMCLQCNTISTHNPHCCCPGMPVSSRTYPLSM
jgi:hypothetical protein